MINHALELFAEDHHGLLTRDAALRHGMSRYHWYRAIALGVLEPLHPGVARMCGTPRSRDQTIAAAVFAAGSEAMASHRSAAHLWGVPRPDDDAIDIILDERTRRCDLDGVVVHRPRDRRDLTPVLRRNIRTSNILRWLCDLGAVDEPGVYDAVGHVLSAKLANPRALRTAIDVHARRGRHGVPAFRRALDAWLIEGRVADSVLETTMNRLLRAHALPTAQFHAVIHGYEVDFWIVGTPIVLECDGWSTHGRDPRQFERDRERDAELTGHGYLTVRFTYRRLVTQPQWVAARIRAALTRWAPDSLDRRHRSGGRDSSGLSG